MDITGTEVLALASEWMDSRRTTILTRNIDILALLTSAVPKLGDVTPKVLNNLAADIADRINRDEERAYFEGYMDALTKTEQH